MKITIKIYEELGYATYLKCYCGTDVYEIGRMKQGRSPEVACPVCGLTYVIEAKIRYYYRLLRPSILIREPQYSAVKEYNSEELQHLFSK